MDSNADGSHVVHYINPNFEMDETDDKRVDTHSGMEDVKSGGKFSENVDTKHNNECRNDAVIRPTSLRGSEEIQVTNRGTRMVKHDGEGTTSENDPTPVKTNAFCRFIARRHKLAFGLTLGCHISTILVSVILIATGYDLIPINFSKVPLKINEDVMFLRGEAWMNRLYADDLLNIQYEAEPSGERTKVLDVLHLYYEGDNVFTKERLQAISKFENELTAIPQYHNFCKLSSTTSSCQKPLSIIRFFDGTYGPSFNDSLFENIPQTLANVNANPVLSQKLQYHLGKDATINSSEAQSHITRTQIVLGYPLSDYSSDPDDLATQFLADYFYSKLKDTVDSGIDGLLFIFESRLLFIYEVRKQVIFDLLLAGGSFVFIILFMLIQTQSFFITGFAIFSILSSFIGTNLVYRIMFDYRYFGIFHVLSVFIILGIGADDIFVYFDTWRDTAYEKHSSLEERVSACYNRAAKSMFITSLTTMIAFIVNAFSPLLAVGSFGLFSGILIFVNYLSVISFFPTVVVMYHKHWESWTWPCCWLCVNKSNVSPEGKKDGHRKNVIVKFFKNFFFKFVTHPWARWFIVLACTALLIVFICFAAQLQPEKEETKIYKDSHNYGKAIDRRLHAFKPSSEDDTIQVYMIWGLKPQDRASCHKTDYACSGKTVWDECFDLNPKPAQTALLNLCDKIRDMTDFENNDLHIRRNTVTGKMDVRCFMSNFNEYFINVGNNSKYNYADFSLPLSESKMTSLIQANPNIYNTTADWTSFYRYFESALIFWLTDGYGGQKTPQYQAFGSLLQHARDRHDTQFVVNSTGFMYGTRLRYAAIVIDTTLQKGKIGYESGIPIIDAWETFTKEQMIQLPPSLSGGIQCTPLDNNAWHWFRVQQVLADSAMKGIIIGICIAFPILTLATQNIILGFLATATISCVTITVVGLIPMSGWKLGVLESLNLSLVVGLAVDYVVHLTEGYHHSRHQDRHGRLQDMLEHVGISVLSGACTTLGASLFMLFAEILFFMQFGIFMFCTIGFSLLYSLMLFTTLLGFVGPENETGSLVVLYTWIKDKMTGIKKSD